MTEPGDLVPAPPPDDGASLHPDRVSIWPVEVGGYGIDDRVRAVLDHYAW